MNTYYGYERLDCGFPSKSDYKLGFDAGEKHAIRTVAELFVNRNLDNLSELEKQILDCLVDSGLVKIEKRLLLTS